MVSLLFSLLFHYAPGVYIVTAKRASCAVFLVLCGSLGTGCLTIARGGKQKVLFTSVPVGAKVKAGALEGVTPCELTVKRSRKPLELSVSLDGHEPYFGEMVPTTEGLGFAALETALFLIPGIIDLGSGSIYQWPYEVKAELPEKGQGPARVRYVREKPKTHADKDRELSAQRYNPKRY